MDINARYNLNRLAYFIAIVEEKTITAASQRLGLSKAVVSKHLQLLEEELGVSLLVRNTRHIRPTKAGEDFYYQAKLVLKQAHQAFESVIETRKEPSGLIRITTPVDFGVHRLSACVAKFCQQYPKIEIEVNLNDEIVDIVSQRYDLSFRVGWLHDSSNRARKIGTFRELAICSPEAATSFSPRSPHDLADLPFLAYYGIDRAPRLFTQQDSTQKIERRVEVQLHSNATFNITSALREALLKGHYFGILPDFTIKKDLEAGLLKELLPNWQLRVGGIYIVSPPSKLRTQALQLFIDMIIREFQDY